MKRAAVKLLGAFGSIAKIAGLVAALFVLPADAHAASKMKSAIEVPIVTNLCYDLVVNGKNGFKQLLARDYRLKKKRRFEVYTKGVQVVMFGAAGIDVRIPSKNRNGFCRMSARGITNKNANAVYKSLQSRFAKDGFTLANARRSKMVFVKGGQQITLVGSQDRAGMAIRIFKK